MQAQSAVPLAVDSPVLSVAGVSKYYGEVEAVKPLSFELHAGEIVGLLGPNGAGKTTTLSMILGVLEPTAGRITIAGHDVVRARVAALQHTNFAAVYAPLPGNITVAENLRMFAMLYTVPAPARRIAELAQALELGPLMDKKFGVLSSGEQSRVCLAKALLNAPRLLLLDEPTASLDPATAQAMRRQIRAVAAEAGRAVLWTSHNMAEVEDMCDRVLFMAGGQLVMQGDPKTLAAQHGAESLESLFISLTHAAAAEAAR